MMIENRLHSALIRDDPLMSSIMTTFTTHRTVHNIHTFMCNIFTCLFLIAKYLKCVKKVRP